MTDLVVDTSGLRAGASDSVEVAAAVLSSGSAGVTAGSRLSSAAIATFDAVSAQVRVRQARRLAGQASDVATGAARYDRTDEGQAAVITVLV